MTNKFFISAARKEQTHLFHHSPSTKAPLWILFSVWVGTWGGEEGKLGENRERRVWSFRDDKCSPEQQCFLVPEHLDPSTRHPCVVNQIKSLWETPLIPCQTKVCNGTVDSGKSTGLHLANKRSKCNYIVSRNLRGLPGPAWALKDFLWPWNSRFSEALGQLVNKTQLRVFCYRLCIQGNKTATVTKFSGWCHRLPLPWGSLTV